jgi:hypothetical protein
MKKGVALLVGVVSVLSVVFVGFFGSSGEGTVSRIYITSVTLKDFANYDDGYIPKKSNGKRVDVINFDYSQSAADHSLIDENGYPIMAYRFDTEILPDDATQKIVHYSIAENYSPLVWFKYKVDSTTNASVTTEESTSADSSSTDSSSVAPIDDHYTVSPYSNIFIKSQKKTHDDTTGGTTMIVTLYCSSVDGGPRCEAPDDLHGGTVDQISLKINY